MAVPTVYTESDLYTFMVVTLGPTATALGWDMAEDTLLEAINDTLLAYGVSDLADATDIAKLRGIAKWQAWRWAADALAAEFNQTTGDQSLQREALHENALTQRDYWHGQAMPYLSQWAVTATPIVHTDDPIDAPIRYAALRNG